MERGHIFIAVTAPAGTEEIKFQCFLATSGEAGQQLHAGFRALRERLGIPRFQSGFCTQEGFAEGLNDSEK